MAANILIGGEFEIGLQIKLLSTGESLNFDISDLETLFNEKTPLLNQEIQFVKNEGFKFMSKGNKRSQGDRLESVNKVPRIHVVDSNIYVLLGKNEKYSLFNLKLSGKILNFISCHPDIPISIQPSNVFDPQPADCDFMNKFSTILFRLFERTREEVVWMSSPPGLILVRPTGHVEIFSMTPNSIVACSQEPRLPVLAKSLRSSRICYYDNPEEIGEQEDDKFITEHSGFDRREFIASWSQNLKKLIILVRTPANFENYRNFEVTEVKLLH